VLASAATLSLFWPARRAVAAVSAAVSPPPDDEFDCEAGISKWETGWSKEKKEWCCTNLDEAFCEGSHSIVVDEETGCDNWKSGSFGPSTLQDSPEKCLDRCRKTQGCVTTNYQKVECPHKPGQEVDKGSCYLMGAACKKGRNECWDLYVLPEHERMAMGDGFTDVDGSRPQTWCSNIDEISTDPPQIEWSVWACKLKCQLDSACTGILYQPGDCSAPTSEGARMCRLLRGTCEESYRDGCWELHYKSKEDAPSATRRPTTSRHATTTPRRARPSLAQTKGTLTEDMDDEVMTRIMVEDWKSLRVGDRLKICAKSADKIEFARIHAVGPEEGSWILEEKLTFPHPKGTVVVLQDGDCPEFGVTTTEPEELPPTTTTTATTHEQFFFLTESVSAGKFDIMVDKHNCFERGDKIIFVGVGADVIYDVVDKSGWLRLDPALAYSYEAGTSVVRVIPGGDPGFCGHLEPSG